LLTAAAAAAKPGAGTQIVPCGAITIKITNITATSLPQQQFFFLPTLLSLITHHQEPPSFREFARSETTNRHTATSSSISPSLINNKLEFSYILYISQNHSPTTYSLGPRSVFSILRFD
jgi:hypothetical protein